MSAADEVLKLRDDVAAYAHAYSQAADARDQYRKELKAATDAIELQDAQIKNVTDRLDRVRKMADEVAKNGMALADFAEAKVNTLTEKLTWWRAIAIAEGLMLFGVWANTYLFGGAA